MESIPAKNNVIADFLSRHQLWEDNKGQGPKITDKFGRTVPIEAHVSSAQYPYKPLLQEMRDASPMDEVYTA